MPTPGNSSYSPKGRSSSGFVPFLLGILFTLTALILGGWLYLRFGHLPVAVSDPAFPMEAQIVHIPLEARIAREIQQPPFGSSEDVFESGAKLYRDSCATCHGLPGHDSPFAKSIYPSAPQLWKKHPAGDVVGVSDDEPGQTFWRIKNGIRLTAMPFYQHLYSDTQMWQVALLLKNADQPLPDPVTRILQPPPR